MNILEIFATALAKDSPAIITMVLVLVFAVFLTNKIAPIGKSIVDDIAKPMVPFAAQALVVMEAQSKSIESHSRITQQLVDTVNDGIRTNRELFELRLVHERQETDMQVKLLQDELANVKKENSKLKKELTTVQEERDALKKRVEALEENEKKNAQK